jgi:hypothetical protein
VRDDRSHHFDRSLAAPSRRFPQKVSDYGTCLCNLASSIESLTNSSLVDQELHPVPKERSPTTHRLLTQLNPFHYHSLKRASVDAHHSETTRLSGVTPNFFANFQPFPFALNPPTLLVILVPASSSTKPPLIYGSIDLLSSFLKPYN